MLGLMGSSTRPPVDGRYPVAGFRHGADVHQPGMIFLPEFINGVDQIPCGAVVDFHSQLGIVICRWRDKGGNVKNQITAFDALQNGAIVC